MNIIYSFELTKEDLLCLAKDENISIPEEYIDKIARVVKRFIESYMYDGAYTVWDAILDGIREGMDMYRRGKFNRGEYSCQS